ncbi:MAG: glycosyltransferase family 39 protein [Leptolinea sp.]
MIGISTRGIQYDDAFSILLARRTVGEIIQGTAADTMPPLYYLILHFWQYMGTSIAFQRLPGIIFSLGIIAVVYKIVYQVENKNAAIWTAAILAVSPLQYYHAQDLRMYSLSTFFILVWDWGALQLIRCENPQKMPVWKWMVIIISGAAALYSHALAGFGLLVPFVFLLLKKDWQHFKFLIGAGLLVGILYLPWLIHVPGQIAKVQRAFWTPVPGVVEVLQSISMILGDIPVPPVVLGLVLFCSLSVSTVCTVVYFRSRKTLKTVLFFILMGLVPPVILLLLSYALRPMFVARGFLSAYVGVSACIGIAAARARPVEKMLIGAFVLLAAICTLPNSIMFNQFPRSPFFQAAEYLQTEVNDRDVILHDNKLSYFPFEVYAPELNSQFLADQPGSANDTLALQTQTALDLFPQVLPTALKGSSRFFFVVFQQTIKEYQAAGGHPIIKQMNALAGQPVLHSFGDLDVLEYSFSQVKP